jgi:Protein of unknown function (DUF4127)
MRVGILPVDSRPCNQKFGKSLGEIYQKLEVDILPLKDCGYFMQRADLEAVEQFLLDGASKWDYAVVSIDMLCYGGLIHARQYSDDFDLEFCLKRMQILDRMKSINPQLKIMAYSVIMRLSVTASSNKNVEIWENIFQYSKYAHLNEMDPETYGDILKDYTNRIPPEMLDNYLTARERNHMVNRTSIDFAHNGTIDYLDLCQEDSHQYGLHVKEQEVLAKQIKASNLETCATIKNGTDEEVSLLFGRCVNLHEGKKPRIYLHYMKKDPDFIALYEDRPLVENLEKNIYSSNCVIVDHIEESNCILIVSPFPSDKQYDLVFEEAGSPCITQEMTSALQQLQGYPYAFLDVTYANGGSRIFLEHVLDTLGSDKLMAYSAWNTASNSIGTIAGQLSVLAYSPFRSKENMSFLLERLIDDCLYQGDIRQQVNVKLKQQNEDVWRFLQPKQNIENLLRPLLLQETNLLLNKYFSQYSTDITFTFPWDRTFELDVAVKIK